LSSAGEGETTAPAAAAACCDGGGNGGEEETAAAGASDGAVTTVHAASGGGGGAEKEISIGALMAGGPSCAREIFLGFGGIGEWRTEKKVQNEDDAERGF
jgi:hypothetical protein